MKSQALSVQIRQKYGRVSIERRRQDVWTPPERNMVTGHRTCDPADGAVPIMTRHFPIWWWPFEIVARMQARMAKYLTPELRAGVERSREDPDVQ